MVCNVIRMIAACLLVGLMLPVPTFAWQPKPIAELDLMNDRELALEAVQGCIEAVGADKLGDPDKMGRGFDYMRRVALVARKRAGAEPVWVADIQHAATRRPSDYGECGNAFRKTYPDKPGQ